LVTTLRYFDYAFGDANNAAKECHDDSTDRSTNDLTDLTCGTVALLSLILGNGRILNHKKNYKQSKDGRCHYKTKSHAPISSC
jgi:hypothetical protein